MNLPSRVALLYDDSAYVETLGTPGQAVPGAPAGLMGRQVAGKEFLDAYFRHGDWDELVGLVYNQASAASLAHLARSRPSAQQRPRNIRLVDGRRFHASFFPNPPAPLLHTPCPPDPSYAWARQHGGPGSFALCGVTHTLCTPAAVGVLGEFVTAPYEPYDALICTSQAVLHMVRTVTGSYADYLRDRHGGTPGVRPRLEVIPLGVNPERFRPPTPEERAAQRHALGATDDEVVVLFVGRLAHHAKAHPVPMFLALAAAARATGRKTHLVLAGWSVPAVLRQYEEAARTFAPDLRVSIVDGTRPDVRFAVWHAADVFTSLSDNIQETFGLVILEAMACGLPVLASDWDGYRDLVADGETGYLVPTWMVRDALADATSRLLTLGELDYDGFLAECCQAVAVNVPAAAAGYARLLADADLRRRLGAAGRQRVLERFTWAGVVQAYEALWRSQEALRQAQHRSASAGPRRGPARYPVPEVSFADYTTEVVDAPDELQAVPGAAGLLERLLATPMTSMAGHCRLQEAQALRELLARADAPRSVAELDQELARFGASLPAGRATLAWMLKYGLLHLARSAEAPEEPEAPAADAHTQALAGVEEVLRRDRGRPALALARLTNLLVRYRSLLLTGDVAARWGLVVQSGPFAGMKYLPTSTCGPLLPKLLGCYEAELHGTLERAARRPYRRVVNVGCGEGYYAVGLARLLPEARVYAFDTEELARSLCAQLAALNDVADRVVVAGKCDVGRLRELAGPGALVLCDCEGGERELLEPELVPGLRQCDILVELHDVACPGTSQAVLSRFEATHEVTRIGHGGRDWTEHAALRDRPHLDQLLAMWEGRSGPTPWAWMTPRAGIPPGPAAAFFRES
jgi:glycosyltransferase involved in cell wall biosynthesis